MRSEPTRVFLGGVNGAAGGGDVFGGEGEFVGTEHFLNSGAKAPLLVRFNVAAEAATHKTLTLYKTYNRNWADGSEIRMANVKVWVMLSLNPHP
jgi:hypothetical protein